MRILTGTSGFSYKEWKGSFYPADLPAAKMLGYYAARFGSVEINNTFYRMPSPELLAGWAQEVPEGFSFALKAPQRITHISRLKDAGGAVEVFLRAAAELGAKLGPSLFQLPPNMKKDLPRLRDFLAAWPHGPRAAFEFRHASWFDEETFDALRERSAALCIADAEELSTPVVATAPWGYLRLRRQDYGEADVRAWADKIRAQAWTDAFVFFKHEDEGKGPALAAQLASQLGTGSGGQ